MDIEEELKRLAKAGEIDFPITDEFVEAEIKRILEDDCPHDEGYVNGYCKICREHWRGD